MENKIELTLEIKNSPDKVWETLTNVDKIEQYMFGARTKSTWVPGSSVNFYIEQNGKEVHISKGEVIKADAPYYLEYTQLPTDANVEDSLENYVVVIFEIKKVEDISYLFITHKGFSYVANGQERYIETIKTWKVISQKLQDVAEKA